MTVPRPIRLLVVDDDESFRLSLEIALKMSDRFVVDTCASGEEAIEYLKQKMCDVVLLDYKMPELSGLDVLAWMHQQNLQMPVIMLTAAGSEEVAVEAMKLGAYDYLSKEHIEIERLPVIIDGVHERALYRREVVRREREHEREQDRERELAALKTFQSTVNSIGQFVTQGLDRLTKTIETQRRALHPHVRPEGLAVLEEAFSALRTELNVIGSGLKSMLDLSSLVNQKLEDFQRDRQEPDEEEEV